MITREDDGYWLELSETIAAHHEEVFGALTTSGGLSRWFCLNAKVDLRTGGSIVFCWDEKCTKTTTRTILNYDAGGRIVWDWFADYQDAHAPVYWTVEPVVEKGSTISLRQGPFGTDVESTLALAEESAGWQWNLCNLRSVLEISHDMRTHRPL